MNNYIQNSDFYCIKVRKTEETCCFDHDAYIRWCIGIWYPLIPFNKETIPEKLLDESILKTVVSSSNWSGWRGFSKGFFLCRAVQSCSGTTRGPPWASTKDSVMQAIPGQHNRQRNKGNNKNTMLNIKIKIKDININNNKDFNINNIK